MIFTIIFKVCHSSFSGLFVALYTAVERLLMYQDDATGGSGVSVIRLFFFVTDQEAK